jgi:uncharacterized RDD family membrane protein YckC
MEWLWFGAPLLTMFVAIIVSLWPSTEERRLREAVARWLDELLGPLPKSNKGRRVRGLPPGFDTLVAAAGGGTRVTDVVLVPKVAYAAVRVADMWTSSNQVSVVCRLAKAAPTMVVRPLPIVDGRPMENNGILFSKDEDFGDAFLVEGSDPKAVRKWLDDDTRAALLEMPEVWLRTDGKMMALTHYGHADEGTIDELVDVADALFANRGAGGGASLFGDSKPKPKKKPAPPPEELAPIAVRLGAGAIDFGLYLLAAVGIATMVGAVDAFHPSELFNSPDLTVTEPWQGGWTTKGFGAFVTAETALALLICCQAYLAARYGTSIGKRLLGARIVRIDGKPMNFVHGVLLRSWIFGALLFVLPLYRAYQASGGMSARAFFAAVPAASTLGVGAVVVLLLCGATIFGKQQRGVHDMLALTKVVRAPGFAFDHVQLGVTGLDPVTFKRLTRGLIVMLLFIVINAIAFFSDVGFWIY